ncbi:MAG: hypothetical protein IJP61_12705 [Treponema sp.]|nr:hypothetical protein [Treponema sp.]
MDTSFSEIVRVSLSVLKNPKVIITAIIVFVYMDLCAKVVRYRKKIKKTRVKKKVKAAPAPAPAPEQPAEQAEDGGE